MNNKSVSTLVLCLAFFCTIPVFAGPAAPADYVQIHNGKFVLHGKPFVMRGTNYFGAWLYPQTIDAGNGIEHATIWSLYHDWDSRKTASEFGFLRSQLRATAVRIGTPEKAGFDPMVKYHDWQPWFEPDGSITESYKKKLVELADTAQASGIRIHLCLLWGVGPEMGRNPDDFAPGATMDRFYSNQVRTIGQALRDHPGVMSYSIGNEVLVLWPSNYYHHTAFEGRAAAFIRRRLHELRTVAPYQLLTDDEGAGPPNKDLWHAPDPDLALLSDPAEGQGTQPFRLADELDYLGTHWYPESLKPEDCRDDAFAPKIADAVQKLEDYMIVAKATDKPVVVNEFGLPPDAKKISQTDYERVRDQYYQAFLGACEKNGVQGLLTWVSVPRFVLRPGDWALTPSTLNQYSPFELDIHNSSRRILFYDPNWDLFVWTGKGDTPEPTPAAKAIASSWSHIPLPRR